MHIAPAIHTESKVRHGDREKQHAIKACMRAAFGNDRLLPVWFNGRRIAWVGSDFDRGVMIEHRPWMDRDVDRFGRLFGNTRVDDIFANKTVSGRAKHVMWNKSCLTSNATRWCFQNSVAGDPGPTLFNGTANTSRRHSDALDATAIRHGGNVSPLVKRMQAGGFRVGATGGADNNVLVPFDLVVSYDQHVTSASLQSMSTTSGSNDALRYVGAGDPGLAIMCAATGANGSVGFSLAYTSDTGTAPEGAAAITANMQTCFTSIAPTSTDQTVSALEYSGSNSILCVPLRVGDTGAKQIDSVTGTGTGATLAWLLGYPYGYMHANNDTMGVFDFLKETGEEPIVLDGACISLAIYSLSGSNKYGGWFEFEWG